MKSKKRNLIILLILIITILVVLGIVLVVGGIHNKEIMDFKKDVEQTACEYAKDENITEAICLGYEHLCKVNYETLISHDYLKADLINPLTGETISNDTASYVQISWPDSNTMTCTYKEG